MVGVLIRMKLRVLSHSFGGARGASFVSGALVGLVAGAFTAYFITYSDNVSISTTIAAAMFLAWALGWLVGPIVLGGSDETLRPENFALLPLSPIRLAFGLLSASIAGVPPVATVIAFAGLVVGACRLGVAPVIVAVVGVVLALAFTVLLSRVVIGLLGAVLGSRRGKDLGVLLAALAGLAYIPLRYVGQAVVPVLLQNSPGLATPLRWLPTGWAPAAVEAASHGDWLLALGAVTALAIVDGLLLLAWSRLLTYRLTTAPASSGSSRADKEKAAGRGRRTLLPATPIGATIGKELRMWWRDPRRRVMIVVSTAFGLFLPVFSSPQNAPAVLPYAALWIVVLATLQVSNLYGLDGTSTWHTIVTPGAARADVRGRQWAWALVIGPFALLCALVLPAVVGRYSAYPWVLGLLPALLGGGAGFILLLSVYQPYPMPPPRGGNPFSAGNRPGFSQTLVRFASMVFLLVSALPSLALLIVGALGAGPLVSWLAVPVGVASGTASAWWLGKLSAQRLLDRGPELLAVVRAPARG